MTNNYEPRTQADLDKIPPIHENPYGPLDGRKSERKNQWLIGRVRKRPVTTVGGALLAGLLGGGILSETTGLKIAGILEVLGLFGL